MVSRENLMMKGLLFNYKYAHNIFVQIKRSGTRLSVRKTGNDIRITKTKTKEVLNPLDYLTNNRLLFFKEKVENLLAGVDGIDHIEFIFIFDFQDFRIYISSAKVDGKYVKILDTIGYMQNFALILFKEITVDCNTPILNRSEIPDMLCSGTTEEIYKYFGLKDDEALIAYFDNVKFKVEKERPPQLPNSLYSIVLNQILNYIDLIVLAKFKSFYLDTDHMYFDYCQEIFKMFIIKTNIEIPEIDLGFPEYMHEKGEHYSEFFDADVCKMIEHHHNYMLVLKMILISFKKNDLKHAKYVSIGNREKFKKTKALIDIKISETDPLLAESPTFKQWKYSKDLQQTRIAKC